MSKSTLKIKQTDEKVIIKLKVSFDFWLSYAIMLVLIVIIPFFVDSFFEDIQLIVAWTFFSIFITAAFVIWFFRRITIDKRADTVTVFNFWIQRFPLSDITGFRSEEKSSEGGSICMLLIYRMFQKKPIKLRTGSLTQANEIARYFGKTEVNTNPFSELLNKE